MKSEEVMKIFIPMFLIVYAYACVFLMDEVREKKGQESIDQLRWEVQKLKRKVDYLRTNSIP